VDDDGLLREARQFLAERPRELIGGAARGERHDEGYRLVGIIGLRKCCRTGEGCSRENAPNRKARRHFISSLALRTRNVSARASFGSKPFCRTPASAALN